MFGFGCGGTLVSYIPKKNKNVLLFSTHKGDDINGVTGKPKIIHKYNETKGGVDVVDKLCAQYNTARATRRWPMVIFYSALNVAGINSFVIYNAKNLHSTSTRREFLVQLSSSLIYPHQKNHAMLTNLPKTIKLRLREICNLQAQDVQNLPPPGAMGRCSYCGWKKNRKNQVFL
ncbi:hypothetical protein NQ314_010362 [Rhamnusium bicolor]|uniref:PiggyBac transposable element-derived protein domain-containing protein n=1 Tax=Rhamnusium bicolor TaxID=1586634 RepID=A0AAV8XSR3_9CUCU|nr:hypothetical protein NQ314_010362 [Rhamnusium bicolor]